RTGLDRRLPVLAGNSFSSNQVKGRIGRISESVMSRNRSGRRSMSIEPTDGLHLIVCRSRRNLIAVPSRFPAGCGPPGRQVLVLLAGRRIIKPAPLRGTRSMPAASALVTSATLLPRLRPGQPDQAAGDEFVRRYGPLIRTWCRQWRLQEADVHD